ncbi:D-isomer specific 2-hydroxyacid dehydrogenase [Chaetomium sp. MPI-SDFR-AT-0129]|nr:D-isomer specific 2-hydroxyacid dehydrogenase [Chaetomium sp. MPI-SDFR-AT-0129]
MAPSAISPPPSSTSSTPSPLRVLVPEKLSPEGLALLRSASLQVDVPAPGSLSPADLLSQIPSYHALIVRSETKVNAAVLAAGGEGKLRVVARAGVGVDNIDVESATTQGVIVVNSPSGNIVAAAEHTIALLLAAARNVGRGDAGMKAGKWERGKLVGVEVGRKVLGIVGFGKVGVKVARMAKGLGMRVLVVDPYASAEVARGEGVELRGELGGMLPELDFLTVHTPLLASTANLLGEKELRSMKPTARVLNVARGGVYNEAALLKALDEGWIAGAGLDVFTSEPPLPDSVAAKLAAHPKVVSTPHLGASTVEAQENVSMDVCTQVVEVLRGGLPTAAVNAPLILPDEYRRLQPFVKLVERIGSLYTQHFATHSRNDRRFELSYHGELAGISNTRPLFAALVKGLVSSISDLRGRDVNIVNATLVARERGIAIDEKHVRAEDAGGVARVGGGSGGSVTLRSLSTSTDTASSAAGKEGDGEEQTIEGYVSGSSAYISRLGRFRADFTPEGTLLVLHNFDQPGKIGNVGMVLGQHGVNINFMQVAALDGKGAGLAVPGDVVDGPLETKDRSDREALMILGVAGDVTEGLLDELAKAEGILNHTWISTLTPYRPTLTSTHWHRPTLTPISTTPTSASAVMDDLSRMSDVEGDVAVVDDHTFGPSGRGARSPVPKSRSLSDGGHTPKLLSPSPHIVEAALRLSKDDIAIRDKTRQTAPALPPSTPVRAGFHARGLLLRMPPPDPEPESAPAPASPAAGQPSFARPPPHSPKLDQHPYASPPTNILPRRSRGLDFSRAATSLHHSTLAAPSSPDSSPTIGSRAMNIPGRRADYGGGSGADQTSTSLWSMMGNHERMHIAASSVGSTTGHAMSDLSSSSDDDDYMDEDMDEAYITTPQVQKVGMSRSSMGAPWMPGSPAASNLLSFQQRQRQRQKQRNQPKKKPRGPIGLGFHSPAGSSVGMSRSPPNSMMGGGLDMSPHARRESISWAANQLNISGNESDDSHRQVDGMDSPSRPSIVRRAVTRRGNLLPKTKGFARIRAALAEESAPVESEFRHEAEVVRQVRESDMDLEPRYPLPQSGPSTALSSPNLATHDSLEEITDDIMMMDSGSGSGSGMMTGGGTFKQQAIKNSKGKVFWDTFSETSSTGGGATQRVTPPPPSFVARASSSVMSLEDMSMDSPSTSSNGGASQGNSFVPPGSGSAGAQTAASSGHGTPSFPSQRPGSSNNNNPNNLNQPNPSTSHSTSSYTNPLGIGLGLGGGPTPPTAAEITRRINSKRRRGRDDDLDPVSIKRRAVSPGMSVHNSPVLQSPLQRDMAPWGATNGTQGGVGGGGSGGGSGGVSISSRPGSVGGDGTGAGSGSGNGSGSGSTGGSAGGRSTGKLRIGLQGMVDTNDGITRLSIE